MTTLAGVTVVFDLDGTLVDTAPDIRAVANEILVERGLRALNLAEVRGLIGHGARGFFIRAFQDQGFPAEGGELIDATRRFGELYLSVIARESRPFPGVVAALDALAAGGAALSVCTNKAERQACALLRALDLAAYFSVVVTPETAGVAKPDPAHLLAAITGAGGRAERAVMVGDSAADAAAARAAGVALILVDFGYCEGPASALEPDILVSHFDQLPAAVARLLGAGAEAIAPSPALDA